MNYVPRIRPASDFEIKPRRRLLSRLYDFLFPLTAEAAQAKMLRVVWAQWRGRRAWIEVTRMYPKMCREFGVEPSDIASFGNRSFRTEYTSDDFK
jgi:hypothetical protein